MDADGTATFYGDSDSDVKIEAGTVTKSVQPLADIPADLDFLDEDDSSIIADAKEVRVRGFVACTSTAYMCWT